MARPVSISDEQILDAAREVFLRDGYGASTVEIAEVAGVSEGSIFRRFPTKEALFRAAVRAPENPSWILLLGELSGKDDVVRNLAQIAREIIRFAQIRLPIAMLGWSNPTSAESALNEETPLQRDTRRLADFIKEEVELGRIRPCEPAMVAQLLLSPCLNHVLDSVTRKKPIEDGEAQSFADQLAQTLWNGLAP